MPTPSQVKQNAKPTADITMTFPAAMEQVIAGQKVTRREWNNSAIYVFLYDRGLRIRKENGELASLLVSDGDMLATDWVVVRDA